MYLLRVDQRHVFARLRQPSKMALHAGAQAFSCKLKEMSGRLDLINLLHLHTGCDKVPQFRLTSKHDFVYVAINPSPMSEGKPNQ